MVKLWCRRDFFRPLFIARFNCPFVSQHNFARNAFLCGPRSHTAPPASQRFPLPIFIYTLAACRGWNKKSWLMYAPATHIEREKERENPNPTCSLMYFLPFHILLHIRTARIIYLTYTDCNKWCRPGPLQLWVEKWGVCCWESDASSYRQHSTFEPSILHFEGKCIFAAVKADLALCCTFRSTPSNSLQMTRMGSILFLKHSIKMTYRFYHFWNNLEQQDANSIESWMFFISYLYKN